MAYLALFGCLACLLSGLGAIRWSICGLFAVVPLAMSAADWAKAQPRLTMRYLLGGYILHAYGMLYLVFAQLLLVPLLFLVGPVWVLMLFLTVADLVMMWIPTVAHSGVPLLCQWAGMAPPRCITALVVYHLVSAVCAYAAFRYGARVMGAASEWYHRGIEWIRSRVAGSGTL